MGRQTPQVFKFLTSIIQHHPLQERISFIVSRFKKRPIFPHPAEPRWLHLLKPWDPQSAGPAPAASSRATNHPWRAPHCQALPQGLTLPSSSANTNRLLIYTSFITSTHLQSLGRQRSICGSPTTTPPRSSERPGQDHGCCIRSSLQLHQPEHAAFARLQIHGAFRMPSAHQALE